MPLILIFALYLKKPHKQKIIGVIYTLKSPRYGEMAYYTYFITDSIMSMKNIMIKIVMDAQEKDYLGEIKINSVIPFEDTSDLFKFYPKEEILKDNEELYKITK